MEQDKSANQLYKESGSQLPFLEWLTREKEKGKFIYNKAMNDKLEAAVKTETQKPADPETAKAPGGFLVALETNRKLIGVSLAIIGGAMVVSYLLRSKPISIGS